MLRSLTLSGLLALAAIFCVAQSDDEKRLEAATAVLHETMAISDQAVPQELLDKGECVVVIPGMKKGAFIVGAQYGRGFLSCRKAGGAGWSAPGAVRLEGGSIGFQIGGQETDIILLVMSKRGADRMMTSKFTLGGDVSVAAGPVGRTSTAETDAMMRAEILSWSRSRGVFAGVSLKGSTMREDGDVNKRMYGKEYKNKQIVDSGLAVPKGAQPMLAALTKYSPRRSN
ncbi:MAG: lipid-binding SYLF domain-containing protein [Bryobacterales bacterium]|nr:lipid-binding SYLF domain-containing protein [Bryobacterales bacterium]